MSTIPSSTVLKAFAVLDLYREHRQLGVTQCSELLNMPRPTAHRLLVSLVQAGALEQGETGSYRLSLRMFEIGTQAPFFRSLNEHAQPGMEELSGETGLNGHLAIRDATDVLYLLKVCGRSNRVRTRLGVRNPLYATALGKILLAHSPAHIIEDSLAAELRAFTPHTLTDPHRLLEQIEAARVSGFAYDFEERHSGIACAATAIRDRTGSVVAAISVTAPVEKYRSRLNELHGPLARAARRIEKRLNSGSLMVPKGVVQTSGRL